MRGVLFFPVKIDGLYHTHAQTHSQYQAMMPAYQTAQGQIAGQGDTHMHTRTHKHTQSTIPAYQTARGLIAGRGDTHAHTHTHSQRSLPTRLHEG